MMRIGGSLLNLYRFLLKELFNKKDNVKINSTVFKWKTRKSNIIPVYFPWLPLEIGLLFSTFWFLSICGRKLMFLINTLLQLC